MKTLLITMVLAIACASPIVATEKQQQTNLQNEVVGNNADNGTTPISLDAVYKFLKAEGYNPKFQTADDNSKYIIFPYKEAVSAIIIKDDFVVFYIGSLDISERFKSKLNTKELSYVDLIAGIYTTCNELSQHLKCVKVTYNSSSDIARANVETFIPTMEMFKHYFSTYMDTSRLAIAAFDDLVDEYIEDCRKKINHN
ncbi:MAG: hypothetical protein E7130_04765 [Rikenellaceae bacterium]|nr:hypothetical protein [Rikenellaceae bacterium]